jgi:hypothetical protein
MATIRQLASGHWQVQIRRKGRKASETFIRHDHAREWAIETEAQIDRGRAPSGKRARNAKTLGALIDLHIDDMKEVGRPLRRSKSATLEMLHRELGGLKIGELDRVRVIRFVRERALGGAGPVTLGQWCNQTCPRSRGGRAWLGRERRTGQPRTDRPCTVGPDWKRERA